MDDDHTIFPSDRGPGQRPADDDATRLQRPASPAAAPLPVRPTAPDGDYLPVGYVLQEFEVTERLGQGGFSIAYRAWDRMLQREVALKEYMPTSMARRQPDCSVVVQADRYRDTFHAGLRSYIEEAKTLAGFDHPALVRVYRYFEANGTAYMVMQLVLGATLEQVAQSLSGPPDEAWLMDLLDPLTAALQVVHAKGIAHRDIAPDNIMILEGSRRPLLLDFGAARRVIGDNTKAPTAMLKPSYAPIEQYPETGLQQGAHTDVYALAAVMHRLLAGRAPPNSQSRSIRDTYEPLSKRLAGQYSARLLHGIDHALALDPKQRTATIEAFRQEIGIGGRGVPGGQGGATGAGGASKRAVWPWAAGGGVVIALVGVLMWWPPSPGPMVPVQAPARASEPAAAPTAGQAVAEMPPATPVAAAPSIPDRITPAQAFEAVMAGSSPEAGVVLSVQQARLKLRSTPLRMQLSAGMAGHYHVLVHDTDGALRILFPADAQEDTRIKAGQTISLPRPIRDPATGLELTPTMTWAPEGQARLLAIVSESPIDLRPMLKAPSNPDPVLVGDQDAARLQQQQPARPYLLGQLACGAKPNCPERYGAALGEFSVGP